MKGCLCQWHTPDDPDDDLVSIMRVRAPSCPLHGDDTAWFARIQERAWAHYKRPEVGA